MLMQVCCYEFLIKSERYAGRLFRERSCCRVQDHFFVRWESVVLKKISVKKTACESWLMFLSGVPRAKLLGLRGVAHARAAELFLELSFDRENAARRTMRFPDRA